MVTDFDKLFAADSPHVIWHDSDIYAIAKEPEGRLWFRSNRAWFRAYTDDEWVPASPISEAFAGAVKAGFETRQELNHRVIDENTALMYVLGAGIPEALVPAFDALSAKLNISPSGEKMVCATLPPDWAISSTAGPYRELADL